MLDPAVEDRLERREELGPRDLGEEAKRPEIHAENRNVASALGDDVRRGEQSAIAAQDEDQVGVVCKIFALDDDTVRRRHHRSSFPRPDNVVDAATEPGFELGQGAACGCEIVPGDDRNPHQRSPFAREGTAPSVAPACRACRRCSMNSRLPSAPVMGDSIMPMRANPTPAAAAVTSACTRAWTPGSLTSPPRPTSSRPASNCGLTSATTSASGARSAGTTG